MTPPDWIPTFADPVLAAGKRVLAVEGIRDAQVYSFWLQRLTPAGTLFTDKLVVVPTGGKRELINGLAWYRDHGGNPTTVFGLRDRDEWDAARLATETAALPQLRVNLDRHCLESYFCDPTEVAAALVNHDPGKYSGDVTGVETEITANAVEWLDHWSLWIVTNRLNAEMRGARFPHVFHAQYKLPADAVIQARLAAWAAVVEPVAAFNQFDNLRAMTRARPVPGCFRSRVYAKSFFPVVVCQKVLQGYDPQDPNDWMIALAEWAPAVPADIAAILQPLLV